MNGEKNSSLLLECIGQQIGVDLSFDGNGQCFLLVDDRLAISISDQDTHYIFYGMIGEFPDPESEKIWKTALCVNCDLARQRDGSLGFEASTDSLILLKEVSATGLNQDKVKEILARFIFVQEKLIAFFSENESDSDDKPKTGLEENILFG